ncbi:MAG: hypothetical protein OEL84_01360 [Nitrosopumilus sp.]|nr:hypothetical protein [Nitrosopumilus sp.]
MVYETILVPHAGTEAGDKALNQAIRIAKCESSLQILAIKYLKLQTRL